MVPARRMADPAELKGVCMALPEWLHSPANIVANSCTSSLQATQAATLLAQTSSVTEDTQFLKLHIGNICHCDAKA